tara:strand:- start:2260 stop:3114 length:855 start_codon:yes stop_codon:yes gene_type:complete
LDDLVTEVLINGVAIPIGVAVLFATFFSWCLGPVPGGRIASAAIGVAFLAGYSALFTWPDFPPVSSGQKLVFIVLAGVVVGAVIDLIKSPALLKYLAIILWPAAIIGWLGWRQITNLTFETGVTLGLLFVAAVFMLDRLANWGTRPSHASVVLLVASIGASFIAFIGASGSLSQSYAILAASAGGFLLCNWPKPRFTFGTAALMAGGGAFLGLATSIVLFSEVHLISFALLLLVFLAPAGAQKLPWQHSPALGPIMVGVVGAIPVIVGTAVAIIIAGDSFELPF